MSGHTTKIVLISFVCSMLLGACAGVEPVYNVNNQRIPRGMTLEAVESAIIESGRPRGWIMKVTEPGHIVGKINVRDHHAAVDVFYDTESYSIMYGHSTNLDYADGRIHGNYNGWIMNLDRDIQTTLSF